MKGIIITKEIKYQFEERISFLKEKLFILQEEFNQVNTIQSNRYNTVQKLKMINPDWKTQKLLYTNELVLWEEILKDVIVD